MKTSTPAIVPVIVCLVIFLLLSTPCQAEPRQVILKEDGNVCMINSQGWIIKQFPVASSPHNMELQVYNNLISLTRGSSFLTPLNMAGTTSRLIVLGSLQFCLTIRTSHEISFGNNQIFFQRDV